MKSVEPVSLYLTIHLHRKTGQRHEIEKICSNRTESGVGKYLGRLIDMRVEGISVPKVKGYGEYANFLNPDWMVAHTRTEIFTEKAKVDEIVAAIMGIAHTSMPGDGIVAVLPVENSTASGPNPRSCLMEFKDHFVLEQSQ